ncbi:hypothetical protein KY285_008607 [Solanum tuberosum]|nr:hypothetical protein KY285_008607 [Solanum tuberosum]
MANQETELASDMALDSSLSWDISRWTMQSMHFNNEQCTSASVTFPQKIYEDICKGSDVRLRAVAHPS